MAGDDRKAQTRAAWLEVLKKHAHDFDAPANDQYWSPRLDTASRDELTAIQNDKLKAVTPTSATSGEGNTELKRLG